jgi:hypothetical protein
LILTSGLCLTIFGIEKAAATLLKPCPKLVMNDEAAN